MRAVASEPLCSPALGSCQRHKLVKEAGTFIQVLILHPDASQLQGSHTVGQSHGRVVTLSPVSPAARLW